jgi:hypothetical protein
VTSKFEEDQRINERNTIEKGTREYEGKDARLIDGVALILKLVRLATVAD